MPEKPTEQTPLLLRAQFGLRTLLIGVVVLSILIGGAVLGWRSVEYSRRVAFWNNLSKYAADAADAAEEESRRYQRKAEMASGTDALRWEQEAKQWAKIAKQEREEQAKSEQLRDRYSRLASHPWESEPHTSSQSDPLVPDDLPPLDPLDRASPFP